jgi:hypothetical protein
MFKDPIVEETRKAGYSLAAAAGFNPKKFINNLRKKQYSAGRRPVPPPAKISVMHKSKTLDVLR